jgi:hypothetical protein
MARSIPSTAAKERSLRAAGVYAVFYGTIPNFRENTMQKWLAKVKRPAKLALIPEWHQH